MNTVGERNGVCVRSPSLVPTFQVLNWKVTLPERTKGGGTRGKTVNVGWFWLMEVGVMTVNLFSSSTEAT